MSDDAAKHAVLLDALEAAGFPRIMITGAGNTWRARVETGQTVIQFEAFPSVVVDNIPSMSLKMSYSQIGGEPDHSARMGLSKKGAQELGAFLLAWGYAP